MKWFETNDETFGTNDETFGTNDETFGTNDETFGTNYETSELSYPDMMRRRKNINERKRRLMKIIFLSFWRKIKVEYKKSGLCHIMTSHQVKGIGGPPP